MRVQKAAVIGHPIGHTLSPFLHERLFALSGIPLSYQVLDVPELEPGLPQLRALDCFNVTIPHKTGILSFLDQVEGKARLCGSVNTVKSEDGSLFGTTTDGEGCFLALRHRGLDFSGDVLLLGNGGAARAIAFEIALRRQDFRLTLACREASYPKAQALGHELAAYARERGDRHFQVAVVKYGELELDAGRRYDLLINATSVGMLPHTGESPVSAGVVSRCGAVFDAVYNPEETELLRLARERGVKAVGGLSMLVYQAVASHRFWYGTEFDPGDIEPLCRDAQRELDARFGPGRAGK